MALFRRGKWYWTDFSVNGQRFRQPPKTQDHRKAPGKERDLIAHAMDGKLAARGRRAGRLAFCEAADRYLEHRTLDASVCTWKTETDKMKPLRDFCDTVRLSQITADSIRSYQAHRHSMGRHPRT